MKIPFDTSRSEQNISPEFLLPVEVYKPLFLAMKVAVTSASTDKPLLDPEFEQIPDGISRDKTGYLILSLLISDIALSIFFLGSPLSPIPIKESTITVFLEGFEFLNARKLINLTFESFASSKAFL